MAPSGHHPATVSFSRRQVLTAAMAVTATAALSQTSSLAATSADLIPAVDTHQHLWDLNRLTLPWLKGAPEILRHNYGLPEYAQATAGMNVVQAVYMEVDVRPEDHVLEAETLVQICRSGNAPTIAAVISGRPGLPTFEPYIKGLSKSPEIRGVRQVLHSPMLPGPCASKLSSSSP
ncbi:MAG UNVERIFIED_CONTAM: hypothetical protein LVR18_17705 [Planctomycetaceae bacterium]